MNIIDITKQLNFLNLDNYYCFNNSMIKIPNSEYYVMLFR